MVRDRGLPLPGEGPRMWHAEYTQEEGLASHCCRAMAHEGHDGYLTLGQGKKSFPLFYPQETTLYSSRGIVQIDRLIGLTGGLRQVPASRGNRV